MTYTQLLDHYKTQGAIAKALEVSQAAVSLWQRRGIPKLRQYQIAAVIAAEPKTIAAAMPFPASTDAATVTVLSAAMKPFYTLTNDEIEAMGVKMGVKPIRGETWSQYRDRLLACGR